MKLQLLFALLLVLCLGNIKECYGQAELKPLKELFKPLSDFENDTTAYLTRNYGETMSNSFKGRTIGDILKNEKEVPFQSFIIIKAGCGERIIDILFFTTSAEEVKRLYKSGESIFGVNCSLETLERDESKKVYDDSYILGIGKVFALNGYMESVFKDLKINFVLYYDQRDSFGVESCN